MGLWQRALYSKRMIGSTHPGPSRRPWICSSFPEGQDRQTSCRQRHRCSLLRALMGTSPMNSSKWSFSNVPSKTAPGATLSKEEAFISARQPVTIIRTPGNLSARRLTILRDLPSAFEVTQHVFTTTRSGSSAEGSMSYPRLSSARAIASASAWFTLQPRTRTRAFFLTRNVPVVMVFDIDVYPCYQSTHPRSILLNAGRPHGGTRPDLTSYGGSSREMH